jgi:hypothetical protein
VYGVKIPKTEGVSRIYFTVYGVKIPKTEGVSRIYFTVYGTVKYIRDTPSVFGIFTPYTVIYILFILCCYHVFTLNTDALLL